MEVGRKTTGVVRASLDRDCDVSCRQKYVSTETILPEGEDEEGEESDQSPIVRHSGSRLQGKRFYNNS